MRLRIDLGIIFILSAVSYEYRLKGPFIISTEANLSLSVILRDSRASARKRPSHLDYC
jgi:hypothetical protein